ncbi:MAG: S-adenosylmethionine:tRNA ribosyltransferase-isomerase [Sphingobacteriia bacterium]|nr:S-adenosylmethionine:tRNA ribosyltransferase-isomerase [Sphingobacteriia bacterium]
MLYEAFRQIRISDFFYELPEDRIARYPLTERDAGKLLVYRNGEISETIYRKLAAELPAGSLLVFNNTRVVEARLLFQKETGGQIEIFCLEPGDQYADITTAMLQKGKVYWKCLVGGAKKWKEGPLRLEIQQPNAGAEHAGTGQAPLIIEARKAAQHNDYFIIELSWNHPQLSFAELLHAAGSIPLPPYLNRKTEEADKERYQTIYAKLDGSVAAPTAGLHFTPHVFESLQQKNIRTAFVTLHVGAGTFKPVKASTMGEHEMHAEFIEVSAALIQQLIDQPAEGIIAVGTTSLRTLESLYWLGVKASLQPGISAEALQLHQWEAYELAEKKISAATALQALLHWMEQRQINKLITKTQIIIAPGYPFKMIKGLITNFHQPQSTLLLIVAAITGKDWKRIYRYAMEHDFRFLSYGDGSLLWI